MAADLSNTECIASRYGCDGGFWVGLTGPSARSVEGVRVRMFAKMGGTFPLPVVSWHPWTGA